MVLRQRRRVYVRHAVCFVACRQAKTTSTDIVASSVLTPFGTSEFFFFFVEQEKEACQWGRKNADFMLQLLYCCTYLDGTRIPPHLFLCCTAVLLISSKYSTAVLLYTHPRSVTSVIVVVAHAGILGVAWRVLGAGAELVRSGLQADVVRDGKSGLRGEGAHGRGHPLRLQMGGTSCGVIQRVL